MQPVPSMVVGAIVCLASLLALIQGDVAGSSAGVRPFLGLAFVGGGFLVAQSIAMWAEQRAEPDATLLLRDGEISVIPARARGRQVSLLVHGGQAVVTERAGTFARVLGPGMARLAPGETVYKIVNTQPRTLSGLADSSTRDGIPLTLEFEVSAQIAAAPAEAAVGLGDRRAIPASSVPAPQNPDQLTWSSAAVVRAAYETHNWEASVVLEARAILRELVAAAYLGDLYGLSTGAAPAEGLGGLQERARQRLAATARGWGLSVSSVRIQNIVLPTTVASLLMHSDALDRSQRPGGEMVGSPSSGALAGGLVVAPVIARKDFTTLRSAVRRPIATISVHATQAGGQDLSLRPLAGREDIRLLPDCSYFAMRVYGPGLCEMGAPDGAYCLLEQAHEAGDGDAVAVSLDERLSLRRIWQRTDHLYLAPETSAQPGVVISADERIAQGLAAEYAGQRPPVLARRPDEVRIVGRAIAVLHDPAVVPWTEPAATDAISEPSVDQSDYEPATF